MFKLILLFFLLLTTLFAESMQNDKNLELDKIFMRKVNKYAKEEIFDKIDNPRI